jgi:hypothetical protein
MTNLAAARLIQMAAQTCTTCNENDILHVDDICCHCGVFSYYHRLGHC